MLHSSILLARRRGGGLGCWALLWRCISLGWSAVTLTRRNANWFNKEKYQLIHGETTRIPKSRNEGTPYTQRVVSIRVRTLNMSTMDPQALAAHLRAETHHQVEIIGKAAAPTRARAALASAVKTDDSATIYIVRHNASVAQLQKLLSWPSISVRRINYFICFDGLLMPVLGGVMCEDILSSIKAWMKRDKDDGCDLECGSQGKSYVVCPRENCHKAICNSCFIQYSRGQGTSKGAELTCAFCKSPYFGDLEARMSSASDMESRLRLSDVADRGCDYDTYVNQDSDIAQDLLGEQYFATSGGDDNVAGEAMHAHLVSMSAPPLRQVCDIGDIKRWIAEVMKFDGCAGEKVTLTWARCGMRGAMIMIGNGAGNADFELSGDDIICTTLAEHEFAQQMRQMCARAPTLKVALVARRHRVDSYPAPPSGETRRCLMRIESAVWAADTGFTLVPLQSFTQQVERLGISSNAYSEIGGGPALVDDAITSSTVAAAIADAFSAEPTTYVKVTFGTADGITFCRMLRFDADGRKWLPGAADACTSIMRSVERHCGDESKLASITCRAFSTNGCMRVCIWGIFSPAVGEVVMRRLHASEVEWAQCTHPVTGARMKHEKNTTYM
ncbi:hypothetical protein JKP88DRAFT_251703 [Tribonema minus]|uniref:Uncharacterized protein n=1 Tax=Tribonema minus TaxID=303371 RepID=A0A835ZEA5_9STRA|nr:hypothetical protein JKP88DRAFT_251703 [Tribonema minus]